MRRCPFPARWRTLLSAALIAACPFVSNAQADVSVQSISLRTELQAALTPSDGSLGLARLSFQPRLKLKLSKRWRTDITARLEAAGGDTGLGSTSTFSPAGKPFIRGDHVQGDFDRAVLTYRKGARQLTLGKQSVAWGVLDGLQITDRYDAIRRREFVFTDIRPERLARWGARYQTRRGKWRMDVAASFDPTVNQLALAGDAFDVDAPRLRAGLPRGAATPPLVVSDRSRAVRDGTYGLRIGRTLGAGDITALVIQGPDTDPVFSPAGAGVRLSYPNRTLIGVTAEQAVGAFVWRLEGAVIPDQDVNTVSSTPLSQTQRTRTLVGTGLDWRGKGNLFVNAQLGLDHLSGGPEQLVRPRSDVIATVRIQKPYKQETLTPRIEVIASLTDRDGVVRPAVDYKVNDALSITAGADLIFGPRTGLFGQFRDETRLWLRFSHSL